MTQTLEANTNLPDRALTEAEVKAMTGLSRTTRWKLIRAGAFPAMRNLSPGVSRHLLSDVLDWLRSREAGPGRCNALGRTA